jgi:DNA polymerase-3 subunit alpha
VKENDPAESFVHLHNHTDYSTLDGMAQPEPLVAEVARQGMPAVAITDHGNMAGAYHLFKAATAVGVKPIIGLEAYVAPNVARNHREPVRWNEGGDTDVSGSGAYTHMTLLAENNTGMHNLFKLSSVAYLEGFYRKPRADRELLAELSSGVIGTTGCPSGEVQTWLRIGDYEQAKRSAGEFAEIFGRNNFFVELMDHDLDIEKAVFADLIRLSKDLSLPLLATNDIHYVHAVDAEPHEALLCVQSGTNLSDPKRFKFDSDTFYVRPAREMRRLFADHISACDNTLLIAERVNVSFDETANLMPKFAVPDGQTEASWFAEEVRNGLKRKFPAGMSTEYKARADYEIEVIVNMGFPGYFLIVADFIRWAKNNDVRVGPGRGSAAGAIVAWALGITELDPIRHGLLFERFLNPERVSMPDIDIDFDDRGRGRVIEYVTSKYGADKVAQIATFSSIKAKSAIKDSARALGYPYVLGNSINKTYPSAIVGRDLSLSGAYDPDNERYKEASEFRSFVEGSKDATEVVNLARKIEGVKRGFGMHAAGIIMSSEPLVNHVPLMKSDRTSSIMTQFEFPTCEALGLVKMDFLGLSNLSTITEALNQIRLNKGDEIDMDELMETLNDPKAYDLLQSGETLGVFQLDSVPIRALLRAMRPDTFDDISAVLALYRPGPMGANAHNDYADRKNNRKPIVPIHEELEEPLSEVLGNTYGLIVFQEQVMMIAQKLAGYSLAQADMLRRAMGKKKKEILDKEYDGFAKGMLNNGYSPESIKALWDILVPFSDYAFNRAHSAAYGLISYLTAYLKANYPVEYMAALLSTNADNKDKTALYLGECRRMGIKVLQPDVNESQANYAAVGDAIRFGLVAVKNVGEGVVVSIMSTRTNGGNYLGFTDFIHRSEPTVVKKRAVESLVKAGAFDSLGNSRNALMLIVEPIIDAVNADRKNKVKNQDSLFTEMGADPVLNFVVPEIPEWDKKMLLVHEREMLGLYVSDHPLTEYATALEKLASVSVPEILSGGYEGREVTIAGLIATGESRVTKKGDSWALLTVEDLDASIPVLLFPKSYALYRGQVANDTIVTVTGKVQHRDDGEINIIADKLTQPDLKALRVASEVEHGPIKVSINEWDINLSLINKIKEVLSEHQGDDSVVMAITKFDGSISNILLGDEFKARRSRMLFKNLEVIIPA